jgi:hypothetical protein
MTEDRSHNKATGITGRPIDPKTGKPLTIPEEENYYICDECGQSVDKRLLGEVFHHEEVGHERLPVS